jgi:hypothetical protein
MAGWLLLPGLVRPMIVVVRRVGLQHRPQVRFAVYQHPVRALGPDGPHRALGITIPPEAPAAETSPPAGLASAKIASNTALNLASRSRIRNLNEPIRSPKSISRFRVCCPVHAPSGCAVTPTTWTSRVAISVTNSTYRRLRKTVSAVKK